MENNTGVMNVELRTSTRKGDNKKLKREGYLLGNIAGKGVESIAIAVKKDEFRRSIKKLGRNGIFKLAASDGQKYTVMAKEIHIESIVNEISHLDFQMVSLTEKIKQEVAIKITGTELLESKRLLINSSIDSILVEGLPQDIPDEIVIDVSNLEAGASIEFSEVKLPEGITANLEPDQKMITVVGSKIHEAAESEDESESE